MCTLALSFKRHAQWPVIVAANRDEMLDRPARAPFVWPQGFVAPRDERAGGSWLGLTPGGFFVGITNRFPTLRDAARLSRGSIVIDALEQGSARAARERLGRLDAAHYNGFHLLYADDQDAFITWSDGAALHHLPLEPGLHVVTERSFGGDDGERVEKVRANWPIEPDVAALQAVTRATYVFAPDFNYGTRSSLVLLSRAGARKFFWAEGQPPTPPPFNELTFF
jgi:uncharacterized protein with NRDE domain